MKMCLGKTPINNLHIVKHDVSTNDATVMPSDIQAGVTAYARGRKITGTGKCFEFANYGGFKTNFPIYVPTLINVIEIVSTDYPIKMSIILNNMRNIDFSISQNVGSVIIDNIEYPITAFVSDNLLTISCEQSINLQVFYGKDNYV